MENFIFINTKAGIGIATTPQRRELVKLDEIRGEANVTVLCQCNGDIKALGNCAARVLNNIILDTLRQRCQQEGEKRLVNIVNE